MGSDADIVIFDPSLERVITSSVLKSNAGYSVYEAWRIIGAPTQTIRRGETVVAVDNVLGQPGSGHLLECGPTRPL